MDYTNYKTIQVMKQSDKAEILFAAVDGFDGCTESRTDVATL